jgi:hypothetical protein
MYGCLSETPDNITSHLGTRTMESTQYVVDDVYIETDLKIFDSYPPAVCCSFSDWQYIDTFTSAKSPDTIYPLWCSG